METDERLVDDLRKALAHLDDPPYLEGLELAARLKEVAGPQELSQGQALRRALRLAIAVLDPGEAADPELHSRTFQVLYHYAIGRQSVIAIGLDLGISERQTYRELHRAVQALACILGEMLGEGDRSAVSTSTQPRGLREELVLLSSSRPQEVDLTELVQGAVEAVHSLAIEQDVSVQVLMGDDELCALVNRVMLRQAIVNLLSHMLADQRDGAVLVQLCRKGHEAVLELSYHARSSVEAHHATSPLAVGTALLDSLNIKWRRNRTEADHVSVSISLIISTEYTLLVVDDNPDIIRLYGRYLRGQPYRVEAALTADEAVARLADLTPDAIILDVMMPERDGWELLQTLRTRETDLRPRIIVCSIIDDPQLAAALGADAFLHKPVNVSSLLQALEAALVSET